MLSKIREKIHDMLLYHIEPGSEGAKKSDHFNVFWDTLVTNLSAEVTDLASELMNIAYEVTYLSTKIKNVPPDLLRKNYRSW